MSIALVSPPLLSLSSFVDENDTEMKLADDAPNYTHGNKALLGIAIGNIAVYLLTKLYYVFRNRQRDRKWYAMTEQQQLVYLETTKDEGNRRLDFRFAQ